MERETLEFDVVVVGAGPAGLSAAIRLAQLSQQLDQALSICVLEKGSTVGANILSGAAIDPRSLTELFPDWQSLGAPVNVPVTKDIFYLLTRTHGISLPLPPQLDNTGNYIISLENFCQWLATQAEQLGVAIFPGFAAVDIIYDSDDKVCGVVTGDKGVNRQGEPTDQYQPGINLLAKQTLFAEGCRGSLTKQLQLKFNLGAHRSAPTYGIGVKEVWQISSEQHRLGTVVHSIGWPLDYRTYGGSFIYHAENNQLALGFVIGLDYQNPYLDPFQELQRFKLHPKVRPLLEGGQRICYGARALNEGGWQALPRLTLPGALILGDSAGTLNVPRIKGVHTAMKSGMIAAETIFAHRHHLQKELVDYEIQLKRSWLGQELYRARNIRPAFHKGLWLGLAYSAIDTYLLRGKAPWTLNHRADNATLKTAAKATKIDYPKPDNKITFDKLSSVFLSNNKYSENQPNHLQISDPAIPIDVNYKIYASPESRYCPANVYEIVHRDNGPYLQINASNCVHCKTCDIKDPLQNINWVPPEGGDGPNYINM